MAFFTLFQIQGGQENGGDAGQRRRIEDDHWCGPKAPHGPTRVAMEIDMSKTVRQAFWSGFQPAIFWGSPILTSHITGVNASKSTPQSCF